MLERGLIFLVLGASAASAFQPPQGMLGLHLSSKASLCSQCLPAMRRAPAPASRFVTMQAAGRSTTSSSRSRGPGNGRVPGDDWQIPDLKFGDRRTTQEIAAEGRELVEEGLKTIAQTPPRIGLSRTLQGARAALLTARDVAQTFQGRRLSDITTKDLEEELPRTLRKLFERLGPTYIKLGQFIASSPTLFPAAYVEEFQKCLDSTERVPFSRIKSIIETELGPGSLESVYSYVDPEPLATASIAQVHAAKLKKTGEDVVIKVQKPGVGDLLEVDLSFLLLATKTLEFLQPELRRLSLGDIATDIRRTMLEELDFNKEAANIRDFETFLKSSGITNVVCPYVFPEASARRVLTMTRFYGKPLTDLNAIRTYTADPENTLLTALNTWMMSVVACASFHADVHAGNLLVLENGKVAFIDFGIVGVISPKTWVAVEGLARGLSGQDYVLMAKALVQLGATSDKVDIDRFAADLKKLVDRVEGLDVDMVVTAERSLNDQTTTVSTSLQADDQEVTRILLDLVALGQEYGIKFPRDFGLLLKQALYFDRYTKLLAPSLDLNDARLRDSFDALARADLD